MVPRLYEAERRTATIIPGFRMVLNPDFLWKRPDLVPASDDDWTGVSLSRNSFMVSVHLTVYKIKQKSVQRGRVNRSSDGERAQALPDPVVQLLCVIDQGLADDSAVVL